MHNYWIRNTIGLTRGGPPEAGGYAHTEEKRYDHKNSSGRST